MTTHYTWNLSRLTEAPRDPALQEPGTTVAVTDAAGPAVWAAPQPLPFRLVLADGSTLTSLADLPADALVALGFITADPEPSHNPATERAPRWDGESAGWVVEPIPPDEIAAALAAARTTAVAANNSAAGRAREAYLTAVPGQATTYAAKQAEMVRWVGEGRPTGATAIAYPWAGDRAGLRGVTVAEVLAEWEAVTAAWEAVGRLIERERERVNEAIGTASTRDAVDAARDSAAYPSP